MENIKMMNIEENIQKVIRLVEIQTYINQISELVEVVGDSIENLLQKEIGNSCETLNFNDVADNTLLLDTDSVVIVDSNGEASIVSSNIESINEMDGNQLKMLIEFLAYVGSQ
ncbi:hypothetical protein [Listeria booriae]|uniref:hypothetical protein n=1 Tax=Listeria booriae TaxID=1552123 RepID=UPI00162426A1|nr:hypothetical protein [Listeria booriae]MBC1227605.1 hypothetical protein [Listeria booriae]